MPSRPTLDGYPTSIGNKVYSIYPHLGPVSYTQVSITPGTVPATGGDVTTALPEAGFKFFDSVEGGVTDDLAWIVRSFPLTVSNPSSGTNSGVPSATYGLQWIANKTATMGGQAQTAGNEAVAGTNLSTFCVRLRGIGPN